MLPIVPALLLFAQAPPGTGPTLDRQMSAWRAAKNWDAIITRYEGLPAAAQGNQEFHYLEALRGSGRWEALAKTSAKGLAKARDTMAMIYRGYQAMAEAHLGHHKEALALYLDNARAGDQPSYLGASLEAMALADWPQLESCAQALLEKDPGNGEYRAYLGEALAKQGRYAEAEPVLDEAVHLFAGRAMAWADLACCRNERKAYAEALTAASQALALEPNLLEALYNHGRACLGLKRYRDSQTSFKAALALNPADPPLTGNLKDNLEALRAALATGASRPAKPAAKTVRSH